MKARKAEVAAAEEIVAKELGEFAYWARGLNVAPDDRGAPREDEGACSPRSSSARSAGA